MISTNSLKFDSKYISYFFLAILLLCGYPIVFCQFPGIKNIPFQIVQLGSSGVLLGILLTHKLHYQKIVIIYSLLLIAACIISIPYHQDTAYFSQVIVISMAVLAYLVVYNIIGLERFIYIFVRLILILSILGTISFILVYFNILPPLFKYVNMDNRPGWFFGLTCTNTYIGRFIRYSGIFDEPGYMAFWGVFALIFNRLLFMNKKVETGLIICLSFTFSLAFYIQVFILLAFSWMKSIKKFLIFTIITISLYIIVDSFKENNDLFWVWQATLGRVETSNSGEIAGNNRADLIKDTKPYFEAQPIFGMGGTKMAETMKIRNTFLGANPYTLLARDGIIGTIIIYSFLLVVFYYSRKDRMFLVYGLMLFLGFLQRPCDLKLFTYFMYIILFSVFTYKYSRIKHDKHNYSHI